MHPTIKLVRIFIILFLLPLSLFPQTNAYAASFVVESLSDTGGTPLSCGVGDSCTLRQAINLANASAGTDTITFSLSGTTTLGSTLPTITSTMTLDGSGQAVTVSGANSYRVLDVASTGNLSIYYLTIANGNDSAVWPDGGGGIRNQGTISTISNSTFSGNSTGGVGGGIYNYGNGATITTITKSTFSGNSASGGGAIYNNLGTITTIVNSTFSGNTAINGGGGILNRGTFTTLANSTFYNNRVTSGQGGGIYLWEGVLAEIVNSTFSGNSASSDGGGIYAFGYVTTIANTIIANNSAGTAGSENCYGGSGPTTSTNNLTDSLGCWSFTDTLIPANHLGPPANNGGPTQTMALLATLPANPAIDSGEAGTCASAAVNDQDQRGTVRPQGAGCDIGAFEFVFPLVIVTAVDLLNGAPVAESASVSGDISVFEITFSEDVYDPSAGFDGDDVTNPANYRLVKNGGTVIPINFVSYSNGGGSGPFQAHILVNNSAFLTPGTYRLTVNGTTSVTSTLGASLAGDGSTPGTDFVRNFSINGTSSGNPGNGNSASAASLPKTGFAPGQKTVLPAKPDQYAYADLGDLWLDIPKLGLQMPIVGVPSVAGQWDVSWLGDRAGWLEGTAYPTLNGNTVITGHVWDADNNPGLFVNLRQLKYGDRLSIHVGNMVYTYEVRTNQMIKTDDLSVLGHSDYDIVTLLTCDGFDTTTGSYPYRRAVQAVLVDTQVK
jgi:LPXTG-site transpeptidase (sortase) family protein